MCRCVSVSEAAKLHMAALRIDASSKFQGARKGLDKQSIDCERSEIRMIPCIGNALSQDDRP